MSRLKRCLLFSLLVLAAKGENCSKHCRPSPSGEVSCLTSGECAEGCRPGFYGKSCNNKCNPNCLNAICAFDNGRCTKGCKEKYCGHRCIRTCDSTIPPTTTTQWKYSLRTTLTSLMKMQSLVYDKAEYSKQTEIYKEITSPHEEPEFLISFFTSTDTTQDPPFATATKESPDYTGIGMTVLVFNVAIICFLFVCVRRILFRPNSRIEATHASIRVIELACMPQHPPQVQEEQPTTSTSYLTATPDTAVKERVVSTHEYDVIDSNDFEPVMLLADCFDNFVTNSTTDPSSPDVSGGKYLTPV